MKKRYVWIFLLLFNLAEQLKDANFENVKAIVNKLYQKPYGYCLGDFLFRGSCLTLFVMEKIVLFMKQRAKPARVNFPLRRFLVQVATVE